MGYYCKISLASLSQYETYYSPSFFNQRVQRSWDRDWTFAMKGKNVLDDRTDQQILIFTHQISPKLFYEIRASRFFKSRSYLIHGIDGHRLTPGHADEFSEAYQVFYNDPNITVDFGPGEYPVSSEDANSFRKELTFVRFDTLSDGTIKHVYRGEVERYWNLNFQQSLQFKADVTWQAHRDHQFKMGVEYKTFGLERDLFGKEVGGIRFLEYQLPWQRGYPSYYHLKPLEAAVYVQDKMDFKNLIINAGVRLDFANSKGRAWKDWDDPTSGVQEGKKKYQISPRIGIGHPITDRATFSFNYGHFFQVPDYRDLYSNQHLDLDAPLPFFGWANMDAQRTIHYEMRIDYQLSDFWKVTAAAWAKENNGNAGSFSLTGFDPDSLGGYSYGIITNNDFGSSKGIDLSVEKRFSDNYFGELQYTYSVSKANQYYSWAGYWDDWNEDTRAKTEYLYRYDTPHLLTGMFGIQFLKGSGSTILGIKPFENFIMQYSLRLRSGYPYTPSLGGQDLEPNTARRPMVVTVDAVFRKDFMLFGDFRAGLMARITNLFDRKNVLEVYSETGSPTEPNPGYSKTQTSTHFDRPHHFGPRRSIDLGFRIEF